MKLKLLLLLLWIHSSSCSQQDQVAYFSSDSSSFIVLDLYANMNGQVHTLVDSSEQECLSIEVVQDFNQNGIPDLFVGHIYGCGGNCCKNAYAFFSYQNGSFVKSNVFGNGEFLESEIWQAQPSVLIHSLVVDSSSGHQRWIKERFVLRDSLAIKVQEFASAKINASEGDYKIAWDSSYFGPDDYFVHQVHKEGQSLWALANKYNTTVLAIKTLNKKTLDSIHLGDQLKIPKPNLDKFKLHLVQTNGETLWSISQIYKVPVEVIKRANQMEDNTIKVGETLKIPK